MTKNKIKKKLHPPAHSPRQTENFSFLGHVKSRHTYYSYSYTVEVPHTE